MNFVKAHGYGNSFIILDNRSLQLPDKSFKALAQKLCNPHMGVGADGLLVMLPSKIADLGMKIFNADGSKAKMCGNGLCCIAYYAFTQALIKKHALTVETPSGIKQVILRVTSSGKITNVEINLGLPTIKTFNYPFVFPPKNQGKKNKYYLTHIVVGAPHTIIFVNKIQADIVATLGPLLATHPLFIHGTNVDFVQVMARSQIKIVTWERGVGLSMACGTGACAAAVAACLHGHTTRQVTVNFTQGKALTTWQQDDTVTLRGNVPTLIFRGKLFSDKRIACGGRQVLA